MEYGFQLSTTRPQLARWRLTFAAFFITIVFYADVVVLIYIYIYIYIYWGFGVDENRDEYAGQKMKSLPCGAAKVEPALRWEPLATKSCSITTPMAQPLTAATTGAKSRDLGIWALGLHTSDKQTLGLNQQAHALLS